MDEDGAMKTQNSAGRIRRFAPIGVIVGGLALGYYFGLHQYLSFESLIEHRDALKAYVTDNIVVASLIYLLAYTAAVAFSFPAASLLTILGGFLFGWFMGGTLTAFAATIGASIIFLAARTAMGDFLKKMAGPGVSKLAHSFEENAFGFLLVLRLAPVFPFFVINIAPALFNVPLRIYVAATFIGILPGTYAYAYLGQGLDSVILSAKAAGRDISVSDLVTTELTIAFAALAVVAAIPFVIKKIRAGREI
ncbi:TVP38/TMEM64 family protein [Hoeflea prorocentri]|uniref:TVP38/TMEM64 family membrane protein n=2 Tax=Hoeflea prorocentri TaxID=1922333 RepID=A0A9X3UKW0_9HYPH|nr:TVP38/TMEM64 family protein [Hoeflea prorocentri]MCY6382705.1 TVP38/TMEM64 family protein [Hoeflea prorocentri]MDA5400505.1 TVP38/TMEM64 family protein [Hoeflea prorocentri]